MASYKHILLIEDDVDDSGFFLETLHAVAPAVKCTVAQNGREALNFLHHLPSLPDIIFLDLKIPAIDGFEFLGIVKSDKDYKSIPIVVLTVSDKDAEQCYKLGADLYINKPNKVRDFETLLTNVLSYDVTKDAPLLRTLLLKPRKGYSYD
jgi:CheY-like chemotaxis protein